MFQCDFYEFNSPFWNMGAILKVIHSQLFINIALKHNPEGMLQGDITLNEHYHLGMMKFYIIQLIYTSQCDTTIEECNNLT
jgi:hypothetical protein